MKNSIPKCLELVPILCWGWNIVFFFLFPGMLHVVSSHAIKGESGDEISKLETLGGLLFVVSIICFCISISTSREISRLRKAIANSKDQSDRIES